MGDYPDKVTTKEAMKGQFKEFTEEIVNTIVKPKLQAIVSKHRESIHSRADLLELFNKEYDMHISMSTMQGWLDTLGIQFVRTVKIVGLDLPAPGGAGARPATASREDLEGFEVRFDNERPGDFAGPRGFGDAFGELNRDHS